MGVGKPDDLVGAVQRGIDLFDCVIPTRSGRTGAGLHPRAARSICATRAIATIRARSIPIAPARCARNFSRAYLHHLARAGEILASMLLTQHNLSYYDELMAAMRDAIERRARSTISPMPSPHTGAGRFAAALDTNGR